MRKTTGFCIFAIIAVLIVSLGFTACGGATEGPLPSANEPTKLTAPTVTLSGSIASWSADPNAEKFEISLDGTLSYLENTVTSKNLSDGETFKIRAVGDGVSYTTSDWSNSVTYTEGAPLPTPTKLTAPTVTLSGSVASWSADPNAEKFEISLDGTLSYLENTVTSKALSDGETFKIRAVGDGVSYTTSDWSNSVTYTEGAPLPAPTKLTAPTVTLSGSVASWSADPNAEKFEISLDGTLSYLENTVTSKALSDGETFKIRAVGDGVSYTTSDWSNSVTYTDEEPKPTPEPEDAPKYLGILASLTKPSVAGGLPDGIAGTPAIALTSDEVVRDFSDALKEYFADPENRFASDLPASSEYELYSKPGGVVYVQIWLDNPGQYTILSLKLNGTKYQVGGNLYSFFIEEGDNHYNCVYVAVTIPADAHTEMTYTVTDVEYISDTYINPDGTDEFMNDNDTVTVGLPYNKALPTVADYSEITLTHDAYSATFKVLDRDGLTSFVDGWLGVAVYDGYSIVMNSALAVGDRQIDASSLVEECSYTLVVYLFADLHDGRGVYAHNVASYYFRTESALDYFDAEAGYYVDHGFPEIDGSETDSGVSVNVSAYLKSVTAEVTRVEIWKDDELVRTVDEFYGDCEIKDLLAETTYLVRLYYSDTAYRDHLKETYVTTGAMEKPEMHLIDTYGFVKSLAVTFEAIENGFLGMAVAKNITVRIYDGSLEELRYSAAILELCDDPEAYSRVQAEYDAAIEGGKWGLANVIYHERLYPLERSSMLMTYGEYSSLGMSKEAWQNFFDTRSGIYSYDGESFFTSGATSYLILKDHFIRFPDGGFNFEITADVDMKDGRGFVRTTVADSDVSNVFPMNSDINHVSFDIRLDGYHVVIDPSSRVNYEDGECATVSYKVNIFDSDYKLVDVIYESRNIDWDAIDEDAWIRAYVLAMKGEAELPSDEEIIEYLGWRAIFEIINAHNVEAEKDYVGGWDDDVVVDGAVDGEVAVSPRGAREKNIANLAERELLKALLAYEYPEEYEYRLKDVILEELRYDEYYYELTDGLSTDDERIEAVIDGGLNSTVVSALRRVFDSVYHYISWYGSPEDEIFVGFETEILAYFDNGGIEYSVNWGESYRRIMMFADFYEFYPYGKFETVELDINTEGLKPDKYYLSVSFTYGGDPEGTEWDSFADGYFIVTGPLPEPTFEIDGQGRVLYPEADPKNFWEFDFEVEIKGENGSTVIKGAWSTFEYERGAVLEAGESIRIRTVFRDGAVSEIYVKESEWSEYQHFEGYSVAKPVVSEYDPVRCTVSWSIDDYNFVVGFSYTVNGRGATVSADAIPTLELKNGDVLTVRTLVSDEGRMNGYKNSDAVTYTLSDTRPTLDTPEPGYSGSTVSWTAVEGATYYIVECNLYGKQTVTQIVRTTYVGAKESSVYRVRAVSSSGEYRISEWSVEIST